MGHQYSRQPTCLISADHTRVLQSHATNIDYLPLVIHSKLLPLSPLTPRSIHPRVVVPNVSEEAPHDEFEASDQPRWQSGFPDLDRTKRVAGSHSNGSRLGQKLK